MRNLKMTIEYEGTRYRGWQVQPNARTIAGTLQEALAGVLRESTRVLGAGRTDAGVHAIAQVASVRVRSPLPPRELMERLNDRLPTDINVLDIEDVPGSFHARHSALRRTYRYQISRRRTAFGKKHVWWVRSRLDPGVLSALAERVRAGTDFRSFAEKSPADEEGEGEVPGRVRLMESSWAEEDHLLIYRITADRFLWKMVRRLVGTMVATALGSVEAGSLERWLERPSPGPAALTAPPSGLFLESIAYPEPGADRPRGRGRGPRG